MESPERSNPLKLIAPMEGISQWQGLTWNLEVMSKCFFMSVPSTWLMQQVRTCWMVSDVSAENCIAHTFQCLGKAARLNEMPQDVSVSFKPGHLACWSTYTKVL